MKKSHVALARGLNSKNRLKRQNKFAIYNNVRLVRWDECRFDPPPRLTTKTKRICVRNQSSC